MEKDRAKGHDLGLVCADHFSLLAELSFAVCYLIHRGLGYFKKRPVLATITWTCSSSYPKHGVVKIFPKSEKGMYQGNHDTDVNYYGKGNRHSVCLTPRWPRNIVSNLFPCPLPALYLSSQRFSRKRGDTARPRRFPWPVSMDAQD